MHWAHALHLSSCWPDTTPPANSCAQFIDSHGLEEAGVDGGGIFKEFVDMVVKAGFDPNLGLFKATTDRRLYPNPHAQVCCIAMRPYCSRHTSSSG